ncbi:GldM family protein [Ferruginibacter albus]|uniref:GldM family protein n=1 Tax=Ferruginibacter albus TaxID=2875540 RepID=UPI001CC4DC57|nr:GldM family protein [Ferruginibacter albus]UAY51196.1 hypothetical protein K9M53_11415 [Ferruginibacter albus]
MRTSQRSATILLVFLLISSFGNLFAQCPAAIVETKTKIFYKDVLNEYSLRSIKGGTFEMKIDSGELLTIDNKKYIKPSKPGKIRITIKEKLSEATTAERYDYFDCVPMPDPAIAIISSDHDTSMLKNLLSVQQVKSIQFLTTKAAVPDVLFNASVRSFTITTVRQNKSTVLNVKGTDNLQSILKPAIGDKIIFTNIKIKVEGEANDRILENRVVEIKE